MNSLERSFNKFHRTQPSTIPHPFLSIFTLDKPTPINKAIAEKKYQQNIIYRNFFLKLRLLANKNVKDPVIL
jgi:hypothetical protein